MKLVVRQLRNSMHLRKLAVVWNCRSNHCRCAAVGARFLTGDSYPRERFHMNDTTGKRPRRYDNDSCGWNKKALHEDKQKCWLSTALEVQHDDDTEEERDGTVKKVIPFLLADIGEGIAEVELLQWFVAPGDPIRQFDRVCEVQSDKATVEITSRFDGRVESLDGAIGDMISVGCPLLHIATKTTKPDEPSLVQGTSASPSASLPSLRTATLDNVNEEQDKLYIPTVASRFPKNLEEHDTKKTKVMATPAVRRLGMEHGIDLNHIRGTGPKGRVLKADLLKLLDGKDRFQTSADTTTTTSTSSSNDISKALESSTSKEVPLRGYNRLMVKAMTASLQIPHMCYSDEVNMNALRKTREELLPLVQAKHGIAKLSYLPFCLKAASLAMKDYPVINASFKDGDNPSVLYHADQNIGVAMDTPRGLVVPVIHRCQELSILDICNELIRLQTLAKEGNLGETDISAATFSLSNIGVIGGTYMSPIVTPPQVAIGAMGRMQRLPRFVRNSAQVEEAFIMPISWGGDHRVMDGATLARFSNQWKAYMESPTSMLLSTK